MRPTPFSLVFAALAGEWFPAIADAARAAGGGSPTADRDRFVLLEPVGRLLREIMGPDAGPDALEAHIRLLHHVYHHWAAGGWVYRFEPPALARTVSGTLTSRLPHPALYLQLPELRVWGAPAAGAGDAPEPLDGMFVAQGGSGIAVLGIFGMREGRPGFSAVAVDGRADADDPSGDEVLVAAARADGSPPLSPMLTGGDRAGMLSVANAGELLLLTCRLLTLLPTPGEGGSGTGEGVEHIVVV